MIILTHQRLWETRQKIFHHSLKKSHISHKLIFHLATVDTWHSKALDVYKNGCKKIDRAELFCDEVDQFLKNNSSGLCPDRDSVERQEAASDSLITKCYDQIEELNTFTDLLIETFYGYPQDEAPVCIETHLIPLMKLIDKYEKYIGGYLTSLSLLSFDTPEVD